MHRRAMSGLSWICLGFAVFSSATATRAQTLEPIVHTVKISKPESHAAEVEAVVPTSGRPAIEIMMPVWSPGFYVVEDYAGRVADLKAIAPDGTELKVEHPQKNRWRIETGGKAKVTVTYRVVCDRSSVTSDYVGESFAVFNGAPTFITLVEQATRPHEIRFVLPPAWKQTMTALEPAADHATHHYRAPDYETLVDSPVVAGNPSVHEFEVDGSKHLLVDIGETGPWNGALAAKELQKLAEENRRLWGFLPFKRYVFLNVFRRGGGGLEHKDSTLLTAAPPRVAYAPRNFRWLSFVSHEYFHAFNVKRLRPVELGPFDFEHPPKTSSLWIAEGFTSYYGELIVARSGLGTTDDFLASLSSHIDQVQNSPGRLLQSLEQSSLDVWSSGVSGVRRDRNKTVDYYAKGPIVGFLLDARIQRATAGKRSLDDVMRQAYRLYAGERGFTPDQFRMTAQEIAGVDLKEWYQKNISSTKELDYTEALDWFGLQFAPDPPPDPEAKQPPKKKWKLELREGATDTQKSHLKKLTAPSGKI